MRPRMGRMKEVAGISKQSHTRDILGVLHYAVDRRCLGRLFTDRMKY